ncbi:tify domain [Musa troglodytarum]|uniref:Tify domain n=1 Tax=Musa troglodytarum TaxID=320322 RepID=A0A9E7KJU9_9LILI|nr:tify domain [Musa troglodytarum]
MEAIGSRSLLSFSCNLCKTKVLVIGSFRPLDVKTKISFEIVCHAMLQPRKFMQRRKKVEVFKDAADEAEQKKWRKLMKEIEELGSAVPILKTQRAKMDALPRDLVLGTLVRFKQLKKWDLVSEMQRAGVKPDVVSYALLISAYGKARREQEALAVFEEMLDAGVRPTRKAYNILLDAFAISGMVEEARTVFKSMRRDKYEPDLCSYSTMLSAYVNASDMDGAEKFFRRIKEDGLKPNVVVYGTLMKGYAKLNNLEKIMRVYERMHLQGVEANQTIYTTIMDAHGKISDFGSAAIWFKEMSTHGLPPDQKAKNILLSLAKTPEEQKEANELVGNPSVSLHDSSKDSQFTEFVGDDEHGEQLKGAKTTYSGRDRAAFGHLEVNASKFTDLSNDVDNDDDDVEEDEEEKEEEHTDFIMSSSI